MCGLVGFFGGGLDDPRQALTLAAQAIAHRGPDDFGYWRDDQAGLSLAHRRLAILDLSAAGHQPMASDDGRWVIAFNGEIYNHLALREALPAPGPWRGHSDTETLLASISALGLERTLESLIGMFAFALWDRDERRLYLVRDRLGEKPLYYGWVGQGLAFASDLKALRALPGFSGRIDRAALAGMMTFNAVPAPRSIYEDILKLVPGAFVCIDADDIAARRRPAAVTYWRVRSVAREGVISPIRYASDAAATDALESVLKSAVESQMISDVPLGAFLSGGIDSSTIVALMQAQSSRPIKTFSIGFHEESYNEAEYAKAVAAHLGTEHRDLYVDDAAARDVIPALPGIYSEPFADLSQIPTFLLSRLAREHVTVSLSGDAGDELFGGYSRYLLALKIWASLKKVPSPLRRPLADVLRSVSPPAWNRALKGLGPLLPARYRAGLPGHKIHRGADLLAMRSFSEFYREGMLALWSPGLVLGDSDGGIAPQEELPAELSHFEQMMLQDLLAYLPDDILAKVDRAAMAVGLETRVPFLDRRVVEFAWRLPHDYRVRGDTGKWLLRQVLARYVPKKLFDRPKKGFGVPLDVWLRGPLREWAEDLLAESRLRQGGYFDPAPIRRRWAEHLSGHRDWQYHLWPVLMFESWNR